MSLLLLIARFLFYSYGRVEILSGFVNGIFLVVISFFVFLAAIQRLFDPPKVNTNRLLVSAVNVLCLQSLVIDKQNLAVSNQIERFTRSANEEQIQKQSYGPLKISRLYFALRVAQGSILIG